MPERDDAELQREAEEKQAALWAAYLGILALGVNEFEARIQGDWMTFNAGVEKAARKTRRGLAAALAGLPDTVDPWDDAVLEARATSDTALWQFRDKILDNLGVVPAGRQAEDPESVLEVFNRRYRIDEGGPAEIIGEAQSEAGELVGKAGKVLSRAAPKVFRTRIQKYMDGFEENENRGDFAASASFLDNVIRAIEQKTHQQSMTMVDATAGPVDAAVVEEAAEKFDPAGGVLEPCFLTHQRSTFRSTLAGFGQALSTDSAETKWLYYEPLTARAGLAPEGFGASHYGLIKTQEEWEKVRKGLDHTRPGSYVFTTGFHVNDAGYLLPVPALLLAAAVEDQRKERQRFLEKKRAEEERENG